MTGGWGSLFWLIVALILCIIEGMTVQLVCIWFAAGSLFACLAAFVGAPFWLQMLVCLVVSVAVLIVGRPLLLERVTPRKQATNADRVIGTYGIVKEEIDNLRQSGRVSANGLDWTARSEMGEVIPAQTTVIVSRIDGVKLIVRPAEELRDTMAPAQQPTDETDEKVKVTALPTEVYATPEIPDAVIVTKTDSTQQIQEATEE